VAPDGGLRTLSNRLLKSTSKSATMIASTREAVSKVMSELQRDGVIETRDHRVVVPDRKALSERASGLSGMSVDGQLRI
jgi:Crp-like helix-turn-helix domain